MNPDHPAPVILDSSLLLLALVSFVLGAISGFGELVRSQLPLNLRVVCSYVLNSGLAGLAVMLLFFSQFGIESLAYTFFASIVAGWGGVKILDYLTLSLYKVLDWIVHLRIGSDVRSDKTDNRGVDAPSSEEKTKGGH